VGFPALIANHRENYVYGQQWQLRVFLVRHDLRFLDTTPAERKLIIRRAGFVLTTRRTQRETKKRFKRFQTNGRVILIPCSPFWYLGSGWEVPHDVADRDRVVWKALKDQRTEPQSAGWRPVTIQLEFELDELPDLFRSGSKYVISPKLRRLCERFHTKSEYLPVKIAQPSGNLWPEQYAVMHPLEVIDCIDFEKSDFDRYGSGDNFIVARFRRLVLRPEKIAGRAVFRPQRYSPIFASEAFRQAVLRARLAVDFYAPEGQEPKV